MLHLVHEHRALRKHGAAGNAPVGVEPQRDTNTMSGTVYAGGGSGQIGSKKDLARVDAIYEHSGRYLQVWSIGLKNTILGRG